MPRPTTTTKDPPPPQADLHAQIVSVAPTPAAQAATAEALRSLAPHLEEVNRHTGLNLTLAVPAYTPAQPSYPFTLRRRNLATGAIETIRVTNLATENAARAQGYT